MGSYRAYIGLYDGVHMSSQDAAIRQDLIENGVEHELVSIQDDLRDVQQLDSAVESKLEHDLLVWPREYLESYLDSDSSGKVPLNEVRLQDLLEAAFERDAELAFSSRSEPIVAPEPVDNARQPISRRTVGERSDLKVGHAGGATGKGLEQSNDESQSSLKTAISQLSDSMRLAAGAAMAAIRCQIALTGSGVYTGRIVADTPELLIQRISSVSEVAHLKELLTEIPHVDQLVRIAYRDSVPTVREIHEHKVERELSR